MTTQNRLRTRTLVIASALWAACAATAHADDKLNTLAAIQHALEDGDSVAVAIDLSQCVPQGDAAPSQTRGGRRIEAYRIVADGTLSFGESHTTVARDGQPILQFMRYQVRPDQTVDFTTYMFNLPGYDQRTVPATYRCAIGQGIKFRKD
ncbi:VirK family protein [Paracidovorax anthurii]|uniref:VirK protein n=1 Tax=Paracidovorax anthurii TaxID=78229 RepID=A0A328Z0E2_9BURK|nr:VirK family protein [Paracidovorax anthurii]RAR78545.1 VirK protein [Paracidovorax anthurii]